MNLRLSLALKAIKSPLARKDQRDLRGLQDLKGHRVPWKLLIKAVRLVNSSLVSTLTAISFAAVETAWTVKPGVLESTCRGAI
jgi:hypothetical protein